MQADKEERKKALGAARERLAKRKREREQLKSLRELRQSAQGTAVRRDFGQTAVAESKELIKNWEKSPDKPKEVGASPNFPGRRLVLSEVVGVNQATIVKLAKETYTKEVATDALEIAQDADLVTETTTDGDIESIMREFMAETVKPWPPAAKNVAVDELETADMAVGGDGMDLLEEFVDDEKEEEATPELSVMAPEQAELLLNSKDFKNAFETRTKWMERALGINERHSIFWELDEDTGDKDKEVQKESLKFKQTYALKDVEGRAVTCLHFSPTNADYFLSAHAKLMDDSFSVASDGTVHVWNYMLEKKPEYVLQSQSMITAAQFHPTNPRLVLGTTVSGQLLCWDIRVKNTPQYRSRRGHSAPVYSMQFLPTAHRKMQHILTVSNDAKICMWNDDRLVEPTSQSTLRLKDDFSTARAEEIPTTCLSFPPKDTNLVVLGSDEGCIYRADIHSQSDKDALLAQAKHVAHEGPITNVQFHPSPANRKVGRTAEMLFLTSSYDWSVKLWHNSKDGFDLVGSFSDHSDYVYDVQWSPTHPAVFACGDGAGHVTVYDLNYDFESALSEPITVSKGEAVTKVQWGHDGKQFLAGDSSGAVHLYEVNSTLYEASDDDYRKLDDTLKRALKT